MQRSPLLMIPGPVELSPAVVAAAAAPPASHLDPNLIAAFGRALVAMRRVWGADAKSQPFVVAGGGTIAMEAAACNLVDPGETALVAITGYFGDRMAEMLRRRGAEVVPVVAAPGDSVDVAAVEAELERAVLARRPVRALFATHVDTSTGVRVDPQPLAALARRFDALSVFDGVCATAGERFEMAKWDADLFFTASQKALGLPPGLALWVAGPRALAARRKLATPPPLSLDFDSWQPVMQAYETGKGAYFSTPATSLVAALDVGLAEILSEAETAPMEAVFARHARAARALAACWAELGLLPVPVRPEIAAHTLSALYYPEGHGNELVAAIRDQGVIVAGGLHSALVGRYFRVGHMGEVTRSAPPLQRTVEAIALALGVDKAKLESARRAFEESWNAREAESRS